MTITQRLKQSTPKFFKKIRNIGIAFAGVSAVIFTAPVELPAVIVKIAGYLAVGVATAVSQTATGKDDKTEEDGE